MIDGEAYFNASSVTVTLRIAMNTVDVLRWAQLRFGGKLYRHPSRGNATVDYVWDWSVHKRDELIWILQHVLPFLKVKHQEAAAMLRYEQHSLKKPLGKGADAWQQWRDQRRILRAAIKEHREVPS